MIKWVVEKPLNEVSFKWFDRDGKEVPYGQHMPWLFEVTTDDVDTTEVIKVELPVCDYASNDKSPIVKIHCQKIGSFAQITRQ